MNADIDEEDEESVRKARGNGEFKNIKSGEQINI